MKEKTANLLVNALERTLKTAGLSSAELIEVIFGMDVPTKDKLLVRAGYLAYFKHHFKKQPEPDQNGLAQMLAALKSLESVPHKMRSALKKSIKELPHAPGGPIRKVPPDEENIVCAQILALRSQYDTREAIRQVARKRNASERTIYRIWGKYYPKKKKRPETS